MTVHHEHKSGNFNEFDYYKLDSLPGIDITLTEGHDTPGVYQVGFHGEVPNHHYQELCEDSYDKTQAVMAAKELLGG